MADVEGALEGWSEFLTEVRDRAAETLAYMLQAAAPVAEDREDRPGGTLRDSLDPDRCLTFGDEGPFQPTATIETEVEYASYTDTGTGAHVIEGNPLLRFFWENGPRGPDIYYFRHVNHPGTLPGDWWEAPMQQRWFEAVEGEVS